MFGSFRARSLNFFFVWGNEKKLNVVGEIATENLTTLIVRRLCKPAFSAFYFASIYGRNDRKIRGERNNMWSYILYYKTTLSFWKWDDKWTKSWSFRVEKKENEILCMSKGPQSSETLSTIRIQKRRSFKNFYFWRLSSFRIAVYSTFNISQQQFEKREANLRKFKLHFSSLFFVFFFIFISGESTNNFSTGFFFLWHYNKKNLLRCVVISLSS